MSNFEREQTRRVMSRWPEGSAPVAFGQLITEAPQEAQDALIVPHPEPARKHGFDVNAAPMAHHAVEATIDVEYLRSA